MSWQRSIVIKVRLHRLCDPQSRLGSYYAKLPGGGRSLFAEGENWKAATLTDLKVQHDQTPAHAAEGAGRWPMDVILFTGSFFISMILL